MQVFCGGAILPGMVGVVLHNCPIAEIGDGLNPGFQLTFQQAIDFAINLIYAARMAQNNAMAQVYMAEAGEQRCDYADDANHPCIYRPGHPGAHFLEV